MSTLIMHALIYLVCSVIAYAYVKKQIALHQIALHAYGGVCWKKVGVCAELRDMLVWYLSKQIESTQITYSCFWPFVDQS